MARNTQFVELDLRNGIVTNESPLVVGPRLWKATNCVWEYPYPRIDLTEIGPAEPTPVGPYFLRMPMTFPLTARKAFTGSGGRWYDIAFTGNTVTGNQKLVMGAGPGSPAAYEVWPSGGGTKLSYHASTTAMTFLPAEVPGCSVYWGTPGTTPTPSATTGTIGLDYDTATKTITRASGSYITDGFSIGDTVDVTLSTNNNGTYTISNLTATVMTVTEPLVANETTGTSRVTRGSYLPAGIGALIFSHDKGNQVYYLLDNATVIRSLTVDVANCPAGAASVAVHLDRLWIGTNPAAYARANLSQLWYTDPLDLAAIRTTNVIPMVGRIVKVMPGQYGTLDTSGVPHLIIGTDAGVHVLDGDPSLGNATLRTLTLGHGFAGDAAAVNTPWGVYYLGNDHTLHRIPPGCSETIPVGEQIRDKLGVDPIARVADMNAVRELSALAWFDPYLYLWPAGDIMNGYIGVPSREGIQSWWGPIVADATFGATLPCVIRQPPYNNPLYAPSGQSGRMALYALEHVETGTSAYVLAFDRGGTSFPTGINAGRTASIQTGLIQVAAHRGQPRQVILETVRVPTVSAAAVVWTVQVQSEAGQVVTCPRLPAGILGPRSGSFTAGLVETQHFAVPQLPPSDRGVAARACSVIITCTATSNLGLQRALLEFHPAPRQG